MTAATQDLLNPLHRAGFRLTRPRRAIARVLAESEDWLRPEVVHQRARRYCPSLGLVTVYRTLDLMLRLGLVRRVHLEDGCHGYAPSHAGHGHYLVCRRCRQVVEFADCDLEPLLRKVSRRTGFRVDDHLLELLGLCPACQRAEGRP